MGKVGKCLQSAEMEIKELKECNQVLQNTIELLEWKLKQNQNLINQMASTLEAAKYFQIELEIKEKLINALQIKLSEKKDLLDAQFTEKLDASCDTEDLIQQVDESCDTYNLIHQIDTSCITNDLITKLMSVVTKVILASQLYYLMMQ